jgi:hypothetical protein
LEACRDAQTCIKFHPNRSSKRTEKFNAFSKEFIFDEMQEYLIYADFNVIQLSDE